MVYTKTTWLEHSMSTAAKKAALDNLEGLYDTSVSYTDAITHSERYYTLAQCTAPAGKFFDADNDGEGSGLICETVDGKTVTDIAAAGVPPGVIAIWQGTIATIPVNWALCDGSTHGAYTTPDLTSKFIICAGGSYNFGTTKAASTATPEASAITIGTTSLTASTLPAHKHTYVDNYRDSLRDPEATGPKNTADHVNIRSTVDDGASTGHGHTEAEGTAFTGATTTVTPEYMALCFIMKVV